jgi:hypothetical protein
VGSFGERGVEAREKGTCHGTVVTRAGMESTLTARDSTEMGLRA